MFHSARRCNLVRCLTARPAHLRIRELLSSIFHLASRDRSSSTPSSRLLMHTPLDVDREMTGQDMNDAEVVQKKLYIRPQQIKQ